MLTRAAFLAALAALACRDPSAPQPPIEAAPPRAPTLSPREYDQRGDEHLKAGRFAAAIADFDRFLEAHPELEPQHWRRGIAYYYAGEYQAGVEQFEQHRTVNPADVENAAWHFLCRARATDAKAAREALLPVGHDSRVPMTKIYALFAGRATADEVVRAAVDEPGALFYAHLYVGLHHEALGAAEAARRHIQLAATEFGQPHYMGDVARVHATLLTK